MTIVKIMIPLPNQGPHASILGIYFRAKEMRLRDCGDSPVSKVFACKHKDPSSLPRSHVKNPSEVVYVGNLRAGKMEAQFSGLCHQPT